MKKHSTTLKVPYMLKTVKERRAKCLELCIKIVHRRNGEKNKKKIDMYVDIQRTCKIKASTRLNV